MAKLQMWKVCIANSFEAFPQLKSHVELAAETIDIDLKHCILVYLGSLHDQFRDYFGDVIQNNIRGFVIHLLFTCNSQRTLRLMKKVN